MTNKIKIEIKASAEEVEAAKLWKEDTRRSFVRGHGEGSEEYTRAMGAMSFAIESGDRKTIQIMAANYWQHEQANSLFLEPEVRSIGHLALVEDMPAVAA